MMVLFLKNHPLLLIIMNTIRITTSQNIELEYDLASLGERMAGAIFDWLIIIAYIIVVMVLFSQFHVFENKSYLIITLVTLPIAFYDLASEALFNGQSIGKRIMKIRVISIEGNQPTIGQYLIRWLFRLIDSTMTYSLCALICVAVSERKQRLGDMVAGTTLIKTSPRTSFQQTLFAPTPDIHYTVSFPLVTSLSDKDVQLIKEVSLQVQKTGNNYLAFQAAEKVKSLLGVETNLDPAYFLQVVIADYNYLTASENE